MGINLGPGLEPQMNWFYLFPLKGLNHHTSGHKGATIVLVSPNHISNFWVYRSTYFLAETAYILNACAYFLGHSPVFCWPFPVARWLKPHRPGRQDQIQKIEVVKPQIIQRTVRRKKPIIQASGDRLSSAQLHKTGGKKTGVWTWKCWVNIPNEIVSH